MSAGFASSASWYLLRGFDLRKVSVTCRPKVAMQRRVFARVRWHEEAFERSRIRDRAVEAIMCEEA